MPGDCVGDDDDRRSFLLRDVDAAVVIVAAAGGVGGGGGVGGVEDGVGGVGDGRPPFLAFGVGDGDVVCRQPPLSTYSLCRLRS